MLLLRPATPSLSPYLTIARLASHLLLFFILISGYEVPHPRALCMTIFTPSSLLWQRWPLSPSFIPSLISSLAKICPIPAAYGEANVNTAGESGGRRARDRHGDKDSDRHGHMHMYEYTHMHNLRKEMVEIHTHTQTLSHRGAGGAHTSKGRDRECQRWHLCALSVTISEEMCVRVRLC